MTTASTPTDLARPPEETRVCIVAITRHGAAQAAQLARDLPEAHICTAAKFAQAFDGLQPVRAYEGARDRCRCLRLRSTCFCLTGRRGAVQLRGAEIKTKTPASRWSMREHLSFRAVGPCQGPTP